MNNGPLGGLVSITGVPTGTQLADAVNSALDLSLAGGAIELNLTNGSLHVDLAGLLKFVGLDINQLCPNTSLLPYVVNSLLKSLPTVLTSVVSSLANAIDTLVGGIHVKVAGIDISANLLGQLINTLTTSVGNTLTSSLGTLDTSLVSPLLKILTDNLLDIVANAQSESGGTLTVTALQLKLLPGGGTAPLPTLPAFKSFSAIKHVKPNSVKVAKQVRAKANAKKSDAKSGNVVHAVRLVSFTRPLAKAAAGDPLVQINLAQASVGPNSPASVTSSPATPAPSTSAPATNVPTGVPAGQGSTGGAPSLPVILLALAAMAAAGTVISLRARGRLNRH